MPCDFCRSRSSAGGIRPPERDLLACEKCATAIEADDHETLLERVLSAPSPEASRDRYAPQYRQRVRELHDAFWTRPRGPADPIPRDRE